MADAKSVFISYSSQDGYYADKLTRMLEKMKISYWKAPEMIPAGSSYAKEIPRAIRDCKAFVLLLSEFSQKSIWVEKEVDSAIYYRKRIIPFQLDDVPLNDMFHFYLNNVQMICYFKGKRAAVDSLKRQICLYVNGGLTQGDTGSARREPVTGQKKDRNLLEDVKPDKAPVHNAGNVVTENRDRRAERLPVGDNTAGNRNAMPEKRQKNTGNKSSRNRTEALTMNHVPQQCQYCGGDVKKISKGTYRCLDCGQENYDYFQTVRNYLEQVGASSALEIERDTGVPRRVVEYLLKQDYLEIPRLSPMRISCERCGGSIRSGRLCELCKMKSQRGLTTRTKGAWHSSR